MVVVTLYVAASPVAEPVLSSILKEGEGVSILAGKTSRKNMIKKPAETMRYLTVKEIDAFLEMIRTRLEVLMPLRG
jgi:hypothetical protein